MLSGFEVRDRDRHDRAARGRDPSGSSAAGAAARDRARRRPAARTAGAAATRRRRAGPSAPVGVEDQHGDDGSARPVTWSPNIEIVWPIQNSRNSCSRSSGGRARDKGSRRISGSGGHAQAEGAGTPAGEGWWAMLDSNQRPRGCEPRALTTEPIAPEVRRLEDRGGSGSYIEVRPARPDRSRVDALDLDQLAQARRTGRRAPTRVSAPRSLAAHEPDQRRAGCASTGAAVTRGQRAAARRDALDAINRGEARA